MSFEYWYMLPIATLIATIAMTSGVEGETFLRQFLCWHWVCPGSGDWYWTRD